MVGRVRFWAATKSSTRQFAQCRCSLRELLILKNLRSRKNWPYHRLGRRGSGVQIAPPRPNLLLIPKELFDRRSIAFALPSPLPCQKVCQNTDRIGLSLRQNPDRSRWLGGSVSPTPRAASAASMAGQHFGVWSQLLTPESQPPPGIFAETVFVPAVRLDYPSSGPASGPTRRVLNSCRLIRTATTVLSVRTTTPDRTSCSLVVPSSKTGQSMDALSLCPVSRCLSVVKLSPELLTSTVRPVPVFAGTRARRSDTV